MEDKTRLKVIETIQYRRSTHNTPCCTILTTAENGICRIETLVIPEDPKNGNGKIVKTMFGKSVYKETVHLRVSTLNELSDNAWMDLFKLKIEK